LFKENTVKINRTDSLAVILVLAFTIGMISIIGCSTSEDDSAPLSSTYQRWIMVDGLGTAVAPAGDMWNATIVRCERPPPGSVLVKTFSNGTVIESGTLDVFKRDGVTLFTWLSNCDGSGTDNCAITITAATELYTIEYIAGATAGSYTERITNVGTTEVISDLTVDQSERDETIDTCTI
jgi:hypothetical protein